MIDQIQVLDEGYVKFIESWGSDERIIESARMSTDGAFRGWGPNYRCRQCGCLWRNNHDGSISLHDDTMRSCDHCERDTLACSDEVSGDEKLLKYLYNHKHYTPFEMAGMVIEVQAPIFVFREWHRHRTQSYNELSARYTPLPDLYYHPDVDRCMLNSRVNKQAGRVKDAKELTPTIAKIWLQNAFETYDQCEQVYKEGLAAGIPKEVARTVMPVGHYSRMRASANLRNWLAFLTLRMDQAAQWEIRQYAFAVGEYIKRSFPKTWELYVRNRNE